MKYYCFTVDDNVRFLREITHALPDSIFSHPYLAMYRRLHEKYAVKVQLNLFEQEGDFDLSMTSSAYRKEWEENSSWLKLSFHSRMENRRPYEFSDYDEVFSDCERVHRAIFSFASPSSLAKTTTLHFCLATSEGVRALAAHGYVALLGLFGREETPRTSYGLPEKVASHLRRGEMQTYEGMKYAAINTILNRLPKEAILSDLQSFGERDTVRVMIHEQYFYPDYRSYQPDFEEKLELAFSYFQEKGAASCFLEELIR